MLHRVAVIGLLPLFFFLPFDGSAQQADSITVSRITFVGLKKTKERVARIIFGIQQQDQFAQSELDKQLEWGRNSLVNSALFNTVRVDHFPIGNRFTEIVITVTERWYLLPIPILENAETNFNTWWRRKDFSRLNYGLIIGHQNMRGRNEKLTAQVQLGYSKRFALNYQIPFASQGGKTGVGIYAGFAQNHEVVTGTRNNERIFYTGVDGRSREHFEARLIVTQRPNPFRLHTFMTGIRDQMIRDTVAKINPNYLGNGKTNIFFPFFDYQFKIDRRDYKHFPLKGWYMDASIRQSGIPGSKTDLTTTNLAGRKFFTLKPRLFLGVGYSGKYTLRGNQPYLLQEGLGYTQNIRGFEYYVIDGAHYQVFKTNISFELIPRKTHQLKFIQNQRFNEFYYALYLSAFSDFGYVNNPFSGSDNNLSNRWLSSAGLGINFLTYYDTVVRLEFSVNDLGQNGFFLHFTQPI